jgi:hypothetical protein
LWGHYGGWIKTVIDEALKQRNTTTEDEEKWEFVVLEQQIFKELQHTSFLSSKY